MAAIFKFDTMRQTRGQARTVVGGAEATSADGTKTDERGKLLLFTGVRYERLPEANVATRKRDMLDLAD